MNKTDIRDLITAYTSIAYGYGKGYRYDWYLEGGWVHSKEELIKYAQEGNRVSVSVSSIHGGYEINHFSFYLTLDDHEKLLKTYRESKNSGRTKNGHLRDFQRSKVYEWENYARRSAGISFSDLKIPFKESKRLLEEIFDTYGKPVPEIETSNRLKVHSYSYHDGSIGLAAAWGNNKLTVIHEATHSLLKAYGLTGHRVIPSHGKEFVSMYMELLEMFLGIPREVLVETAKERGVKWDKNFDVLLLDNEQESDII